MATIGITYSYKLKRQKVMCIFHTNKFKKRSQYNRQSEGKIWQGMCVSKQKIIWLVICI